MVYEAAVVLRENIRTQAKGSTPVSWSKAPPPLFPLTSFIFINYLNWGQPRVHTCPFNGESSIRTNIDIYIYIIIFFSDAFVRQRHFPPCFLLSGRIKRSGEETSSPVRETVIGLRPQVHLWGGATRRSRWVNSVPPLFFVCFFFICVPLMSFSSFASLLRLHFLITVEHFSIIN